MAHDGYAEEDTELFLVLPAGIHVEATLGGKEQGRAGLSENTKM